MNKELWNFLSILSVIAGSLWVIYQRPDNALPIMVGAIALAIVAKE